MTKLCCEVFSINNFRWRSCLQMCPEDVCKTFQNRCKIKLLTPKLVRTFDRRKRAYFEQPRFRDGYIDLDTQYTIEKGKPRSTSLSLLLNVFDDAPQIDV